MSNLKEKRRRIKPKYIKDNKGKTTQIYLDIKTYDAILMQLKKFEKIKNKIMKG